MVKWFAKLSSEKKDLFILVAVGLIVFVCLCPLFLISQGAWPLGWILGSAIDVVSYITIVKFTTGLLSADSSKKGGVFVSIMTSGLRYFLYAAGLIVAAICTFKPEWFGGFAAFNFYACALAYLPMPIVILVSNLLRNKKQVAGSDKKNEGDKK